MKYNFELIIFLFFTIFIFLSCKPNIFLSNDRNISKKLNFSKCVISDDTYKFLFITVPKGGKIKKEQREGLCEYQFIYNDSSILYVSTDVWFGSRLNIENRNNINHLGYHKENLSDTIRLEGISSNNRYWSEHIIGNYSVGYVNATKKQVEEFSSAMKSISTQ